MLPSPEVCTIGSRSWRKSGALLVGSALAVQLVSARLGIPALRSVAVLLPSLVETRFSAWFPAWMRGVYLGLMFARPFAGGGVWVLHDLGSSPWGASSRLPGGDRRIHQRPPPEHRRTKRKPREHHGGHHLRRRRRLDDGRHHDEYPSQWPTLRLGRFAISGPCLRLRFARYAGQQATLRATTRGGRRRGMILWVVIRRAKKPMAWYSALLLELGVPKPQRRRAGSPK